MSPAVTAAPILDVLAERRSTRIFDAETPIDEAALASALEAARWAPSANNTQPWRFVVARRGTAEHAQIVDALMGFNQAWAADAAALIVFAASASLDGKPAVGRLRHRPGRRALHGAGSRLGPVHPPDGRVRPRPDRSGVRVRRRPRRRDRHGRRRARRHRRGPRSAPRTRAGAPHPPPHRGIPRRRRVSRHCGARFRERRSAFGWNLSPPAVQPR